jgi:FkbM family methyltransferase
MSERFHRRDFLLGSAAGVAAASGVALGLERRATRARSPAPSTPAEALEPRMSSPGQGEPQASWSQGGEDLILEQVFQFLEIPQPTYIDIGAYDPVIGSNTYLFYRKGSRGVLVEPNPIMTDRLSRGRPGDTVLNIGIGVTDQSEADFYVVGDRSQVNTFSKERADRYLEKDKNAIRKVLKIPLVNINKVLAQHFDGAPQLFSIDVEGLDLAILESLDFSRFRPQVFCVETLVYGTSRVVPEIFELMRAKSYAIRGGNFVNTVFVDAALLPGSA